jgi:TolB-like protein
VTSGAAKYVLSLLGPFRLSAPDGQRIDVSSKKGQALIAMLAMAGGGERTRSWLQTQLWGSRGADQAQASLRSELSGLRNRVNIGPQPLLMADHQRIWLDLSVVEIDARSGIDANGGEFLEGLDVAGEDGFEDWLREERARHEQRQGVAEDARRTAASAHDASIAHVQPVQAIQDFAALPAIAVLPIANQTGNADLDFIADGISEDLIDRLSRLRWLPVIARSSSFSIGSEDADLQQAGQSLGARYVVEGKLRRAILGDTLSLSLTDTEVGRVVWSNRIPMAADVTSKAMEELLSEVTAGLGAHVDVAEQQRALTKQQSDLNVRDLIWRGRWHLNRMSKEDSDIAKQLFAQALALEPHSPEALIQTIMAGLMEAWAERRTSDDTLALRRLAQQAIIADLEDARGHMVAGIAEIWLRQPVRAESLLRHAISLNPSLVLAHAELGSALYLKGEPEDAIEPLNLAIRLSPNDYSLFYSQGELAISYLMIGDFARAIEFADKAIMRRAAYWYSHVVKINALIRSGESAMAQSALAELRAFKVGFKEDFIDWLPFIDPKWNKFLKEGLNLAGG